MPYIRTNVVQAQPLLIKQIAAETAALVADGAKILSLAQGTPNLPLFPSAVEAMTKLVQSAKLPYTDVNGLAAVRATAASFVKSTYPIPSHAEPLDGDHVLITTGAAQSVYNCLALSVGGPEDVVLSPLPAYGLYLHQTNILNGTFDVVETQVKNDFKPTVEDLEAAFAKHTKTDASGKSVCHVRSLVLCFPNNPVGSTLSKSEAQELAVFLDKKLSDHPESDFSIVLDEVYVGLTESDSHHSILSYASPRLVQNCMLILSVSKGLGAMPGARGGFLTVFSKPLAKELTKIQMACTANCSIVSQIGLQASLQHIMDNPQVMKATYDYYRERTSFCVKRLNEIGAKYFTAGASSSSASSSDAAGTVVAKQPSGTFYVLASFAGWTNMSDDRSIQQYLRDQYRLNESRKVGLACVPGCAFNLDPKLKLIRFSCAVEMDVLVQAMEIVEDAVKMSMEKKA